MVSLALSNASKRGDTLGSCWLTAPTAEHTDCYGIRDLFRFSFEVLFGLSKRNGKSNAPLYRGIQLEILHKETEYDVSTENYKYGNTSN